jgi:hypothetical protein
VGEKGHVKRIVTDVFGGGDFIAIHIHEVTDGLESVERYADGKKKVLLGELGIEQFVAVLNEEIGVFEVKQKAKAV